ncbi:hypothetical protein NE237_003836 [Protea cynaroides]|uniref:DUF3741 domain-containing protein n=1 Tax=Protea cynaroides TaxID=273540 RepID=A0A9Q0QT07_9MAGN|nr:hypothetical protein NE237_003836 [Protea cynaroides]
MKRQESTLSSSSRRETPPEKNEAKSIGCMSGVFKLVCKYQQRRKFLTSARKQDRDSSSSPKTPKPSLEQKIHEKREEEIRSLGKYPPPECDLRRFSCEVPRSPTLPADIRRSNSINLPEKSPRPHSVVARLMGFDENPVASPESATDKRQKLLGALDKCDEDLKSLKKTIESIRFSEQFQSPPSAVVGIAGGRNRGTSTSSPRFMKALGESKFKVQASSEAMHRLLFRFDGRWTIMEDKRSSDYNGVQPSPVSVLDQISSPRFLSKTMKNGEHKKSKEDNMSFSSFHRITAKSVPRLSGCRGDYGEYFWLPTKKPDNVSPLRNSTALIESIHEVCQEVNWGEKWELRRIGLVIQDHIFAGLIEEIVREFGCCNLYSSLPYEKIRKRLSF